jgi:hypothetical protein
LDTSFAPSPCCIQFLNDYASVKSKERQSGEEVYSSEVKYQPKHFTLLSLAWFTYACGMPAMRYHCSQLFRAVVDAILL